MSVGNISLPIQAPGAAFSEAPQAEELETRLPALAEAEDPDSKSPALAESAQEQGPQPELIPSGPFAGLPILEPSSFANSMPYVFCNEIGLTETLDSLATQCKPCEKTVHIGFALWFNLDIISVTKPSYAIICDIDKNLADAFKMISECLNRSTSRMEFIRNLKESLSPFLKKACHLDTDGDLSLLCNLDSEFSREKSWLSSDEQFFTIKSLNSDGKILFQNLDITDSSGKFAAIAEWMKKHDLKASTLYASNVLEWISHLPQGRQQEAIRNLSILAHEETFFIQAYSRSELDKKAGPLQHITRGASSIKMPEFSYQKDRGGPRKQHSRVARSGAIPHAPTFV